jgi:hypothetical protein
MLRLNKDKIRLGSVRLGLNPVSPDIVNPAFIERREQLG